MNLLFCFLLLDTGAVQKAVALAQESGRVLLLGETDADRLSREVSIPPGIPPVLTFRYMEGSQRHRFGDLDLVVDDAGH